MTAALPPLDPELLAVVDRYRTCEFATLSKSGVPIAWPTATLRRPDGTFLITTSIALPQKAYNIRRDPRVALLFSEPTASGIDGAPQLLVQGRATCPDEVVTDVRGMEEYWRRLSERQPINRQYSANALSRRLFDWYYMRLVISISPTSWTTRPPLAPGPGPRVDGAPGGTAGEALRRLAGFPTAVLGTRDAEGTPELRRVRVTGPAEDGSLALDVPDGADLPAGPASLLAHSHDEQLWSLRSVVVIGDLAGSGADRRFLPSRVVPGGPDGGPLAMVRVMRDLRRTARGYLDRRSLPRPAIPWDDLHRATASTGVRSDVAGSSPSSS